MSVEQLKKLLSLNGIELLDTAAGMVGKQPPSQLARPMTSVQPHLIKPTQDEWWNVSNQITAHIEEVRTHLATVMANWDVPKGFTQYMNQMITHLEKQQQAMRGVSWQLNTVAQVLDKAKSDTEEKISEVGVALIGAIIAAVAGALVSGGGAGAVGIGIVIGIIAGLLVWLVNRKNIQQSQLESQNKVIESLDNIIKGEGLRNITPPTAPDLSNIRGFSSIHEPENL